MADTGRVRASAASRTSTAELRYESLAERVPGIAYSCSDLLGSPGTWLYVSPLIEGLLGYTPEEWLADPTLWERCVHPEDLESALEDERRSIETGEPLQSEYRMITRDGRVRWFHDSAELVLPGDGTPARYQGIMLDLTERKLAEHALRESERRKAAVLDASLDAIVTTDHRGCVLEWNTAAERIFGYPLPEALGQPLAALIVPPATRAAHADHEVLAGLAGDEARLGQRVEVTAIRAGGFEFPAELTVTSLASDPPTFSVTIRDISERRAHEREREEMEARLRQMERMETVGLLAGGVAHDFNNLLSVILSFSRMARDALDGAEEAREDLDEVIGAAERAARLTHQLLTFSRREPVRPELLDMREVVREMEALLRRTIGEHVALEVDTGRPVSLVKADPSGMEQVVLNLAVNARDAMPSGGVLSLTVDEVTLDNAAAESNGLTWGGRFVRLVVADTGEGIDPEVAEHIFEPFFTTKPKELGTGLGLATVYGAVAQAGGGVRVDSTPGEGSRFEVLLPVSVSERVRTAEHDRPPIRQVKGETVLVAEDEEAVRRVVCRVLEGAGYQVVAAANGQEALERLRSLNGRADLLLTDVVMPGMAGRELAARATELRPGLAVLYCSGYTDDVALLRDLRDERVAFLEKPFNGPKLLAKVRDVLDAG